MKILSSVSDLRASGFGQPSPRHGLRLLYWFINNCVDINLQDLNISLHNPQAGGFRIFHNREERGKGHLLPDSRNLRYYEFGNLSVFGSESLPEYVREKYTGFQDKSNTDRIIVSLESGMFRGIYVTRHQSRVNFDPSHTFCIGLELVKTIMKMKREDFLRATRRRRSCKFGYKHRLLTAHSPPSHQPYRQDSRLPSFTHHPNKDSKHFSISSITLLLLITAALLLSPLVSII